MKIKKITSLLLSMSIIFGMVNIGTVYAEGNSWDISAAQGSSVTATYDEATKTMTWSGWGETQDFYNPDDEYNNARKATEAFIVEWGITKIGVSAFSGCTSLTSVTVPDSVESVEAMSFANCTSVKIFIWSAYPATFIDYDSFSDMGSKVSGEKTAYIDGRNTKLKAEMEGLGYTIVDTYAGPWDVSEAQDGSVMATYDEATETLTVSGNGRMMDYLRTEALYNVRREEFKKIIIQNGVRNIGANAFHNCETLTTVEIGNTVESIGDGAFNICNNLNSITIPDSVTSIGEDAFRGCHSLPPIIIPDSVKSIGKGAFTSCLYMPSIKLPDNLNNIGRLTFVYCNKIDTFTWRAYPATFDDASFDSMGRDVEGPKTAYIDARNTELKAKLESLGYTIVDSPIEATPDTPSTDLDASNQHPVDENGNGTTKIEITTEPLQMTVTVPVVLPVYFNVKGEATVASNARIVNKSAAPINVTAYNVEAQSGWTFVDTDHDFAKDKAGTKNFSLTVSENVMDMIAGHDELPFQYDSKISGQKAALTDALIGNVVWIVDWAQ